MYKSQLKGLGIALAVVLAGCTSPRDPFLNQQERPTELCLNDGSFPRQLANTDDAFQQQYPMRYVVKKGDTLLILESMKMENDITADFAGTVSRILVKAGDSVQVGAPMVEIV